MKLILCAEDEYDPEVSYILPRLPDCNSTQDIRKMVIEVFTKWFAEQNDLSIYDSVGEKLMEIKKSYSFFNDLK